MQRVQLPTHTHNILSCSLERHVHRRHLSIDHSGDGRLAVWIRISHNIAMSAPACGERDMGGFPFYVSPCVGQGEAVARNRVDAWRVRSTPRVRPLFGDPLAPDPMSLVAENRSQDD